MQSRTQSPAQKLCGAVRKERGLRLQDYREIVLIKQRIKV